MTTVATGGRRAPTRVARRPARRRRGSDWRNTLIGWSFILPNLSASRCSHSSRWSCCSTCRSPTGTSSAQPTGSASTTSSGSSATTASAPRCCNTLYYAVLHIPLTLVAVARPRAAAQPEAARGRVLPHRGVLPLHHLDRRDRDGVEHAVQPRVRARSTSSCGHRDRTTRPAGLTSTDWAMPAVIIVGIWRDMGYYMCSSSPACRPSPRSSTRRPGSTAPTPGSGSATSPCPGCGRPRSSSS